mmetsp:Transcript_43363/g.86751  ORF Transcript_43363/g.86751 Transcript_43363/m.86751 type:complete len:257 (+) Transcript_43363:919-1689(+)
MARGLCPCALVCCRCDLFDSYRRERYLLRGQEAELEAKVCELEMRASTAVEGREGSDEAAASAERRALRAEQSLAHAQQRATEQATALANLQALLEHMQQQVAGPSDELSQMRIGGQMLASELQSVERGAEAALQAQTEVPLLRAELDAAQNARTSLLDEVAGLQALLRAASAAREHESMIDKRLVSSVLIKYFERECSHEVLVVLASMLGCTQQEQQVLGVLPRGVPMPTADAKLTDAWTDFLLSEAGAPQPPRR